MCIRDRCSTFLLSCSPTLLVDTMDYLHQIQWPAMVVTVVAAWLVASQSKHRREIGFWCFLLSNVLWIVWGWHDHAYALILLQLCLAFINIRGALKNRTPEAKT